MSRSSGCASTPISSAASATRARHRPGDAAGIGRIDRDPAEARLEREDAAPAGRQAHRAADVGADVQRPVAGGGRGARAGAAAARVLAQVPGIARQRVEARQARRQHPVVRHRRLAEDHRAGLAQPRRRRRVARRPAPARSPRCRAAPACRAVAMFSLIVAGTPSSAPTARRRHVRASAPPRRAPRRARRRHRARRWRAGAAPTRAMRSSTARVTSTGESERSR